MLAFDEIEVRTVNGKRAVVGAVIAGSRRNLCGTSQRRRVREQSHYYLDAAIDTRYIKCLQQCAQLLPRSPNVPALLTAL